MLKASKKNRTVEKSKVLRLNLRTRVETSKPTGVWDEIIIQIALID